jgi:fucose permease
VHAGPSLAAAKAASRAGFVALGVLSGMWGVHIPSLKQQWSLSEASLSGLLFVVALGALSALGVAGRLVGRFGARRTALAAATLASTMLASLLILPWLPLLCAALALFGACMSVYDVAVNTGGTAIESQSGSPILGQLHGLFSLGAMGGAALAALLLRSPLAPALQISLMVFSATLLVAWRSGGMLEATPANAPGGLVHFTWPQGRLLLIGLLVLCSFLAEGVMCDWSVLYLKQELTLSETHAGLGYALFAGAMAAGRFGTDALRKRCGEALLLRLGGGLCSGAMAVALLARQPALAYAGIALAGLGLAPVVPILLKAATKVPGSTPAAAIASAASLGYAGFMAGPPLVGALANTFSLTAALGVVVMAGALLALVPLHRESNSSTSE